MYYAGSKSKVHEGNSKVGGTRLHTNYSYSGENKGLHLCCGEVKLQNWPSEIC